ncbi:MAG: hypothetical protein ACRERC_07735 [Candidatus Binatia bacterium]
MVMRALMIGRILWRGGGALPLDELEWFVDAAPAEIDAALTLLVAEDFAELRGDGLLRLSERAAADLAADGAAIAAH